MPRTRLTKTLEELHQELQAGDPLDAADREHLYEVLDDIRRVLDEEPAPPTLNDRISEAILQLEVSHPSVATLLGDLVRNLKQL